MFRQTGNSAASPSSTSVTGSCHNRLHSRQLACVQRSCIVWMPAPEGNAVNPMGGTQLAPNEPPRNSPRRGPNISARGRAQRRPGKTGLPPNGALEGRNKTRSDHVRCVALSGLGVVIMLTQGGAARLVPARRDFAVPWAGVLLPLRGEISASNGRQAVPCLEFAPNGRQAETCRCIRPFSSRRCPDK